MLWKRPGRRPTTTHGSLPRSGLTRRPGESAGTVSLQFFPFTRDVVEREEAFNAPLAVVAGSQHRARPLRAGLQSVASRHLGRSPSISSPARRNRRRLRRQHAAAPRCPAGGRAASERLRGRPRVRRVPGLAAWLIGLQPREQGGRDSAAARAALEDKGAAGGHRSPEAAGVAGASAAIPP